MFPFILNSIRSIDVIINGELRSVELPPKLTNRMDLYRHTENWCAQEFIIGPTCSIDLARYVERHIRTEHLNFLARKIHSELIVGIDVNIDAEAEWSSMDEASGFYTLSTALQRLDPRFKLGAVEAGVASRIALSRAIESSPENLSLEWRREFGNLAFGIHSVTWSNETGDGTTPPVFDLMLRYLVESSLFPPWDTVDKLLETAFRLSRIGNEVRENGSMYRAASACIASASKVLNNYELSVTIESSHELRAARLSVFKVLHSFRQRDAAQKLYNLINTSPKCPSSKDPHRPSSFELMWAAFAQLSTSYASVIESERWL